MTMTTIPGFPAGTIRFDASGRASLTDMHRIAGGEARTNPRDWFRTKGARDLVARISAMQQTPLGAVAGPEPVSVVHGGNHAGTWAALEIAREYAFYIAPRFHPWREFYGRPDLLERVMEPRFWPEWPGEKKNANG